MSNNIRIVIIDDHPLVRDGLVHVIANAEGFEIVGMGETAADALRIVVETKPDILILDLRIDGTGHLVMQSLKELGVATKILVLTVSEVEADLMGALRQGASGYALKGISGSDLRSVLRSIHLGETYVAPSLGAKILAAISRKVEAEAKPAPKSNGLSKRESDIYALIRRGYCNKEIGRSLNLSEKTVKHYLTNMFRKLQVRNRVEMALISSEPVTQHDMA